MSIAEAEIGPWLRYQHVGCSGCEAEMEDIGIEILEDLKGLCDERSDLLDTFTQTVDEPKSKRIWEKLVLAWLWDVSVTSCKGHWVVGDSRFNTLGGGVHIDGDGRIVFGTIFGKTRILTRP